MPDVIAFCGKGLGDATHVGFSNAYIDAAVSSMFQHTGLKTRDQAHIRVQSNHFRVSGKGCYHIRGNFAALQLISDFGIG